MLHENNSATNELEREVNGEEKKDEINNKLSSNLKDNLQGNLQSSLKGFQMPANLIAAEFGEVNVLRSQPSAKADELECRIDFTIAMEPQGRFAEGWRTGLALDASASMKRAYGRKVEARVDPELLTDYIKQGRLWAYMEDGEPTRKIQREAFAEIQERGYEINYTENILQPLVQDFTAYLAGSLDGTGKTSLIYWGCGKGDEIQVLGEFDADSCQGIAITGPASFKLGKTTKLLPAIAYFVDQYREAQRGMYIFLTDGRIDDLEKVKLYTKELALEIAVGKRNYLKLILIGIGNDVDRYQLQELDDFDTGLDIDLWDYKIASEMHNLTQIFAEVVNDNQIIAESGFIYDDAGNCVKTYTNGLPAKVDFAMRDDSQWFELEVGNQRIRQSVVLGAIAIAPLAKKQLFDFEIQAKESRNAALFGDATEEEQDSDEKTSHPWWKWLAAVFIGAAFIGTAIAFGILIKRSDDTKLQNLSTSTVNKETETNSSATNRANSQLANNVAKNNASKPNLNSSKPNDNGSSNSATKSQTLASSSNQQKSVSDSSTTSSNSSNKSQTSVSSNNQQLAKAFNDIQTTKVASSVMPSPNELLLDKSDSSNKSATSPVNNFVKMVGELAEKNSLNNFLKLSSTNSMNNSLKELNNSPSNLNNNLGKQPSDNSSNNAEKNIASKSINDSSKNSVSTNSSSSANNNSANSNARNSDRNISPSILPITNPDLEVTIFFPSDEAQLMPPEETKIDNFWSKIQGRRGIIQVSGHTDKTGDYAYNLDLSQARANEVVRLLRDRGLDNNYKITFEALSWLQPLRKNNTATDNAFNRRVVIQFKEQR
ncbi:OmpA family protein [Pseudanabaena yagii]|uniref:OmpA family protein n=1 Tax=Pseudanabaena yagii GIHE-NHR1 TaxID=2722753 RepID=A0ABX1LV79_9CYAN|nr:OmpA family protein [Pseudanabaena yagii]NMF57792.1 OmpA family protein [Pseudanabaena yagii GIHE-NHR1]